MAREEWGCQRLRNERLLQQVAGKRNSLANTHGCGWTLGACFLAHECREFLSIRRIWGQNEGRQGRAMFVALGGPDRERGHARPVEARKRGPRIPEGCRHEGGTKDIDDLVKRRGPKPPVNGPCRHPPMAISANRPVCTGKPVSGYSWYVRTYVMGDISISHGSHRSAAFGLVLSPSAPVSSETLCATRDAVRVPPFPSFRYLLFFA
jgi:hypothetical protein